ncbi:Tetratricopeptide repeat family protein [Borrelia nietonii YOR]|uniref:Tetratricopeptide repeat family protein n=2 Tax=Borreliaceae TaxID=1643685 RepID=A0ABN4C7K0_9SPIR|nr:MULTISPECIES: tetratricopeptide repeat protein [Borrelia]AHH03202.1 Tetratricopeptide repeat family protein [Borrelia nietonii YOR]AHH13732.1 Tetratricopeptide repeat family protein [Borrelia hermsii MTW]UPA08958.1 tetratricopeptide repeat protein [Borrelia nietonii YOR]
MFCITIPNLYSICLSIKKMVLILNVVALFFGSAFVLNAQGIVTNKDAQEEFKWALNSYNNGLYDDALLSFKRVLSFDPSNLDYHFWIGNVYYRLGYVEEALMEWRNLQSQGYKAAYFRQLISIIEQRRGISLHNELDVERLVQVASLNNSIYKRPNGYQITSLKADQYGGYYAVNFVGNEILHFDANNNVNVLIKDGITSLRSPYDVLELGELLYVTLYANDEIGIYDKTFGIKRGSIGKKGTEAGKLLAPQYMTVDERDYIYVSEWGNKRISKFDAKGNFILHFGIKTVGYMGLLGPTGVTYLNGNIYVADAPKNSIEVFDTSGNHLYSIPTSLEEIEGLSSDLTGNSIIISSKYGVYKYSVLRKTFIKLLKADKIDSKISSSIIDVNNQMIVSDFDNAQISVYKSDVSVYDSLNVDVRRVIKAGGPKIYVELNVNSRNGLPVIGLKSENFAIANEEYYIVNPKIAYDINTSNDMNIAIVFDKSFAMKNYESEQIMSVNTLIKYRANKKFSFINATSVPLVDNIESLVSTIHKTNSLGTYDSNYVKTDVSLKLAGSELMSKSARRAVLYFSNGDLSRSAFNRYSIDTILSYYKNNDIRFYLILFGNNPVEPKLQYLVNETGGAVIPFSSYEGVSKVYDLMMKQKTGTYLLEYDYPGLQEPNGYYNLSVEVNFNQQIGRGEFAYLVN